MRVALSRAAVAVAVAVAVAGCRDRRRCRGRCVAAAVLAAPLFWQHTRAKREAPAERKPRLEEQKTPTAAPAPAPILCKNRAHARLKQAVGPGKQHARLVRRDPMCWAMGKRSLDEDGGAVGSGVGAMSIPARRVNVNATSPSLARLLWWQAEGTFHVAVARPQRQSVNPNPNPAQSRIVHCAARTDHRASSMVAEPVSACYSAHRTTRPKLLNATLDCPFCRRPDTAAPLSVPIRSRITLVSQLPC